MNRKAWFLPLAALAMCGIGGAVVGRWTGTRSLTLDEVHDLYHRANSQRERLAVAIALRHHAAGAIYGLEVMAVDCPEAKAFLSELAAKLKPHADNHR